ncbi:amidohydrolase family protein, partial [candidate division KSB1 bacterium]|nr:amidohydrolase family protein [candidate division KSB1 bacterium]NIR69408.1 amidohydrolase family protein [candidate division KSB1 bacterium]NIS24206.1 amidohydrolase family protein [candidate division KSB1 bacterium]NIT71120.1 amidohydrolase family protein [candidate division KSB1 bacterium]NIU24825.1 amidohydrolase family protein [candidate division KSB1 bacterium]
DDFESGSIAAAFGGVTTVFDFTVQGKDQTLKDSVETRLQKARGKCHVDYGLHVNITDEPEIRLWELPELIDEGFTSFKVFSTYREAGMMVTWEQFRQILSRVDERGGLLMLHAEDNDEIEATTREFLSANPAAPIFHALSRTPFAEASAVFHAAEIANQFDASLYIVHLSSYDGLEAGVEARDLGINIYLETCPQYLVLNEECYQRENGHYWITTPPLRTQDDCESLWDALASGEIDVVGTDHCPFTIEQKNSGEGFFNRTPNGLPGVETLFPLLYTYGVAEDRITLEQLVRVLAKNPAKIFGIYPRKGAIEIDSDADLVIWDPNQSYTITADNMHGRADWSPYEGMEIKGKLDRTILRGQVIVEGKKFLGEKVFGELLRASRHK